MRVKDEVAFSITQQPAFEKCFLQKVFTKIKFNDMMRLSDEKGGF